MNIDDLLFSACSVYDDNMFFFTERESILVKMNMLNWEMEIVFYETNIEDKDRSSSAFLLSNKGSIYKLQLDGKKVIEYAVESNKIFSYDINESNKKWANFSYMSIYNDKLYLFPGYVPKVIKIDLQNKKIINKNNILNKLKYIKNQNPEKTFFSKGYRVDYEHVILYAHDRSDILVYNLKKDSFKIIYLPVEIGGIIDVCCVDDEICILDSKNILYRWSWEVNKVKLLVKFSEIDEEMYFSKVVNTNERIILLPSSGLDIFIFNKKENKYFVYNSYPVDFKYKGRRGWSKYINECEHEEYVYFPMRESNYILRINKITSAIDWIKPIVPLKIERAKYYVENKICLFSERRISIDEFVNIIVKTFKEKNHDRRKYIEE